MSDWTKTQDAPELGTYAIRWKPGHESGGKLYTVDFAFVEYLYDDGKGSRFYGDDHNTATTDIKAAVPIVTGSVKWDGCVNWHAEMAMHACGEEDFDKLCQALKDAREGAAEFMPWAPIAEEYRDGA
jgi:hypothetical protein